MPEKMSAIHTQQNILVLSCLGGNGHEAARKALEERFGSKYRFTVCYPFQDLLISRIVDSESFYNKMVQGGFNRVINYLAKASPYFILYFPGRNVVKKIEHLIQCLQPICVISVAPIINRLAIPVCAEHRIPYCLVTLDADLTNWVRGLNDINPLLRNTVITLGADLPQTRGMLEDLQLRFKAVETIGFPIRREFDQARAPREILCQALGFNPEKPIIMLMWGGVGSSRMHQIMKCLGQQNLGAQFVVIAGKDTSLAEIIKRLPLHPSNSRRVLGFTQQIADYMEISDLLITKPGPGTISEAAAVHRRTGRPYVLLDGNANGFFWEQPNIAIAEASRIGEAFENEYELVEKVASRLLNPNPTLPLGKIPKNIFSHRIVSLVDTLVETSAPARLRGVYERRLSQLFPADLQRVLSSLHLSKLPHFVTTAESPQLAHGRSRQIHFSRLLINFEELSHHRVGLVFYTVNSQGKLQSRYLHKIPNLLIWNVSEEDRTGAYYPTEEISRIKQLISYPTFQASFFSKLTSTSRLEIWVCQKKGISLPDFGEDIKEMPLSDDPTEEEVFSAARPSFCAKVMKQVEQIAGWLFGRP